MAKSNGFFGVRRGSTKSLTFSVLKGVQITKDRVSQVRNPKTLQQQIQRVIMNTACQAYRVLRPICNHSFENVAYGGDSQQEFMRLNMTAMRESLATVKVDLMEQKSFTPIGSSEIAPQSFIVSKGTLNSAKVVYDDYSFIISSANTYADLVKALGVQQGDEICVLMIGRSSETPVDLTYCRIIMQPQDANGNDLPMTTPFWDASAGRFVNRNLKNEGLDRVSLSYTDGTLAISLPKQDVFDGAVIVSRNVNGKWLRSTETLNVFEKESGYTLGESIIGADRTIDTVNERYLNNAEKVAAENLL